MQFQRVNRTNAETGFGVFKNVSGGAITAHHPICFTTTAASVDGHQAVAPATGQVLTFGGINNADLADNDVGLYQCYGYRDSVRVYAHGTSVTIGAGVAVGPAAGSNGVSSTGLVDTYGPVVSMEAIGAAVCSPGGYGKAFIRAL